MSTLRFWWLWALAGATGVLIWLTFGFVGTVQGQEKVWARLYRLSLYTTAVADAMIQRDIGKVVDPVKRMEMLLELQKWRDAETERARAAAMGKPA